MSDEADELAKSITGLLKAYETVAIIAAFLGATCIAILTIAAAYHWVIVHPQHALLILLINLLWVVKALSK